MQGSETISIRGTSRTVIIHTSKSREVLEHPGIIFKMDAVDGKALFFPIHFSNDSSPNDNGLIILGDLKIARTIGIKIGFTIKFAEFGNLRMDGASKLDSFAHSFFIKHRQSPGCPVQTSVMFVLGSSPK